MDEILDDVKGTKNKVHYPGCDGVVLQSQKINN